MTTIPNMMHTRFFYLCKQVLYSLKVLIVALAIPVFYYLELSHKEIKVEHPAETAISQNNS